MDTAEARGALPITTEDGMIILQPGEVEFPYRDWISMATVADKLGLSIQRANHHVLNGRMKYITTPLGRLFEPNSVEEFAAVRLEERNAQLNKQGLARPMGGRNSPHTTARLGAS